MCEADIDQTDLVRLTLDTHTVNRRTKLIHVAIRMYRVYFISVLASGLATATCVGQATMRSSHVTLHSTMGGGSERLLEELEGAYIHVRGWGLKLPARVEAWGYSTTDSYVRGSGGSRLTLALTVGQSIHLQPIELLLRHSALTRTLRHEMTHVALHQASRRGMPRWFGEGLSMLVAGERQIESTRFNSLSSLERGLGPKGEHTTTRSAYETARRLVEDLSIEYGRSRIVGLVGLVASRGGFAGRFRTLTGKDPQTWAAGRLKP